MKQWFRVVLCIISILGISGCGLRPPPRRMLTSKVLFRLVTPHGTNLITSESPKDTRWKRLSIEPATGILVIEDFSSDSNSEAITAAQKTMFTQLLETMTQIRDAYLLSVRVLSSAVHTAVTNDPPVVITNSVPVK